MHATQHALCVRVSAFDSCFCISFSNRSAHVGTHGAAPPVQLVLRAPNFLDGCCLCRDAGFILFN